MFGRISIISILLTLALSCARQGTPSGGPKDETPPKYLNSTPDTLSLNVPTDLTEIKINFDEYVVLKDQQNNVIVSPSLGNSVSFQPMGSAAKTVRIKLNDPLKENTTYNINFGNAIQDNNEGNILKDFHFVFSTGDFIDSLMVSGKASVLSERKLPKNLVVGLYPIDSLYNDSIILKQKPFYVARPDDDGTFKLNYLHPGKYQLIAFNDEVENMQFDPSKEKIGFSNEPLDLDSDRTMNIVLFDQQPAYRIDKAEQKGYGQLVFKFNGQPDEVEIKPVDFDFTTSKISYQPKSDSLNFWFNPAIDTIGEKAKRIKFAVRHKDRTDSVSLVYNPTQTHKLKIESKQKLSFVPGRKVKLTANYPISRLDSSFVSVFKDTIQISPKLIPDSKNENAFTVDFPIELNSKYDIEFYPGALTDFFGETNDTLKYSFSVKTRNDYGNLKLVLSNPPKHPFFLKLMSEKDEVLDEQYTDQTEFVYNYLNPGKYYFRIFVDENENGFWDTGDFFERRYPEPAFVYPDLINIRSMWDAEENWILPPDESQTVDDPKPEESADK